jgi:hypothetical protein
MMTLHVELMLHYFAMTLTIAVRLGLAALGLYVAFHGAPIIGAIVASVCLWQFAQIIFTGRQPLRRHDRKRYWEP